MPVLVRTDAAGATRGFAAHLHERGVKMFRRLAILVAEPFRHMGIAPNVQLSALSEDRCRCSTDPGRNAGAGTQDLGQTIASRRAFAATAGSSAP